jgi:hypothetical protein
MVVGCKAIGYEAWLQRVPINLSEALARPAMQPRVMTRDVTGSDNTTNILMLSATVVT